MPNFDIGKLFYYCFLFASLFLLVDPFYMGYGAFRVTRDLGPLKYFGLFFGFAAVFITLVGMTINIPKAKQPPWRKTLTRLWPLLLLGLFVLAGSLIARFYLGIKETFMPMAFGAIALPLAVILFWGIEDHLLVVRRYFWSLLIVMPIVIGWVFYTRYLGGQAFHTEIFLFVSLCVYFFLSLQRRWLAWTVLLAAIALGVASHKNTAYLVLLTMVAHFLIMAMAGNKGNKLEIKHIFLIYCLLVITLIGFVFVTFLLINGKEYLPTGNVAARSMTYQAAIDRFMDSPLWGTGFMDTTLVQLTRLTVLGRDTLITHSDFLDVLSHGGLIGAFLLIIGLYRPIRSAVSALRSGIDKALKPYIHGLLSIVAGGLVTALFNSPLLTLPVGVLFWFSLGLLACLSDCAHLRTIESMRTNRHES